MQTTINILMFLSSLVVLATSLLAINEMTPATNHWVRIAYCLISAASLAGFLAPFTNSEWYPSPACFFGVTGVAIMLIVDRRRSAKLAANRNQIHIVRQHQRNG